ncbi:hypothetical protein K1719_016966 [Acacia pycnantha]|nr:hypothetical protein K1719_016966 [Acacia pycnantha]
MKTNALLACFFFSAVLFAITTAEIVLDTDGDPLKNGGNYSLSTNYTIGGKQIIGAFIEHPNGSWSLAVVAKSYVKGWPTKIASPCPTQNITTYSPLWISFCKVPTRRSENLLWTVTPYPVGEAVMVGEPLSGCFFIKPFSSAKLHQYKLVFFYEHGKCGHVVLKTDSHGNYRLVVTQDETEQPLVLVFHKETSDEVVASDISMVV